MKNILTILFLTVLSFSTLGQTNAIGIKAGLSWTNISFSHSIDGDFGIDGNFEQCFLGGLTYDYKTKKNISFGIELLYEKRKYSGVETFVDPNTNPPLLYLTGRYSYLSIPVKFGLNFGDKFFGYGNIGVVPAYLLQAIEGKTLIKQNGFVDYNNTNTSNKFEIGGLLEIGCGYKLSKNILLISIIRFQKSFTSPDKESTIFWWGMNCGMGIKYVLPNE